MILLAVMAFSGVLYSSLRGSFQVVDVYVCEESITMAEMLARAAVSRKELYVVSYCSCQGVDSSLKDKVTKTTCDAERNMVYACMCIGRSQY